MNHICKVSWYNHSQCLIISSSRPNLFTLLWHLVEKCQQQDQNGKNVTAIKRLHRIGLSAFGIRQRSCSVPWKLQQIGGMENPCKKRLNHLSLITYFLWLSFVQMKSFWKFLQLHLQLTRWPVITRGKTSHDEMSAVTVWPGQKGSNDTTVLVVLVLLSRRFIVQCQGYLLFNVKGICLSQSRDRCTNKLTVGTFVLLKNVINCTKACIVCVRRLLYPSLCLGIRSQMGPGSHYEMKEGASFFCSRL